jgi:RNA polymerase sigma-70 factor, ECF subfamily
MKSTDAELVSRCLTGKGTAREAFDQLYRRHADAVLAFLLGVNRGDEHAARDALQETFLRFYATLEAFDADRPVRAWLFRIGRNISIDLWKKRAREAGGDAEQLGALTPDPGPGPSDAAAAKEAVGLLRRAVHGLPPQELAVFLLKNDQGLTFVEVADALGCSVRTAKYRMRAALERLGRQAERLGVQA